MEKEKEIKRLVRLLRQIACVERFSGLSSKQEELSDFNIQQYNRILKRLKEIEPAIENLFVELGEGTNRRVIRQAARELAGYFAEDFQSRKHKHHDGCCGKRRIIIGFPPFFSDRR
jgi:hypothetical protein